MGAAMRYQPQGRVQINWANPITRGLAFAFVHGVQASGFQVGYGDTSIPYASDAIRTANPKGTALRFGSTLAYQLRNAPTIGNTYSLLAVASSTNLSATQSAIDGDDGSSNRNIQFRLAAGKVDVIPFSGTSVVGEATFPTALTATEAAQGFVMGATVSPAQTAAWQNGKKAVGTPASAPNNFPPFAAIGSRWTSSQPWVNGGINMVAGWSRVLSDDEMRSLAANPWQLFDAGSSSSAYQAAIASTGAATGGTTTNVSPGAGTLAIAGYAPAVAQSANQSVVPSAGSLSLTGYAPSVVQSAGQNVLPGNGSIALTGYAPQVQQSANRAVSPGAAALAVVGYAPSISQSIVTTVAPQPGALALTGFAPTVARTASASISPSAGALTITGYAPGVARTANQTVQAGTGGLTLTGYEPAVSQARVSAYPQLYLATILSQSTLYAVSPLVDALDVDAGPSALQASLAIATIMAESRIYATASLSDAATNQTASFV